MGFQTKKMLKSFSLEIFFQKINIVKKFLLSPFFILFKKENIITFLVL